MNIKEIAFGDLVEIARRYNSLSTLALHCVITDSKAFRAVKKGETVFDGNGNSSHATMDSNGVRFLIPKRDLIGKHTSTTIKVEDIYGDDVEIPEGYRFVKFGIPKPNELTISAGESGSLVEGPLYLDGKPRIIVEKI